MKLEITVVICTHNPRQHYLDKVLAALMSQTLPMNQWELLLIDNASNRVLSTEIDLSWHSHSRHIREENLGLTPTRLRGIREAQTELIIFVDDDNVLESDYLEAALQISQNYPFLGAWGGLIRPEFEVPPPAWTKPYWALLAVREFDRDRWSNLMYQNDTTPCGAGMCIRTTVARHYADFIVHHPLRFALDRIGNLLLSCGDSDLAFTACDVGLGTGLFVSLRLTHLIPVSRLEEEYLARLLEGIMYSGTILQYFRGKLPEPTTSSWFQKLMDFGRYWNISPRKRRFHRAHKRAERLARQEIIKHQEQTLLRSKKPELSSYFSHSTFSQTPTKS